jgi:hypothetical protein
MSDPAKNRSFFPKIVAFMAISFLVGVGLCGLDYALGAHGIGKPNQEFSVGPLDGVSLVVMLLSAVGLVLSLIAWGVRYIYRQITMPAEDESERLFNKSGADKHDDKL